MKPLNGLIELQEDLARDRNTLIYSGITGLGPPDLVCLYKNQAKNNKMPNYHFVAGFPFDGRKSYLDYFTGVLKMRPKKLFGKAKYNIEDSVIFTYNSFSNTDIRAVIDNKQISEIKTKSIHNEDYIDQTSWLQLRISSMLRFWMPSSPVFRAIYHYPLQYYQALRLLKPPRFTEKEIMYLIENHPISEEIEAALAAYLISLGKMDEIQSILDVILPRMPRVLNHFLFLLPKDSSITLRVASLCKSAYEILPDDIKTAFSCVTLSIGLGDLSYCETAIPILLNSLWASPYACCGMALLAIYSGNAEDALFFANAACYSKSFIKGRQELLTFVMPKIESKKSPRARPKAIESELISAQYSGDFYLIYKTVVTIANQITVLRLRSLLKGKFGSPKENPFKISEEGLKLNRPDELSCLYDPGITVSCTEAPEFVRKLHLSIEFSQIANNALNDLHIRDTIVKTKRIDSSVDAKKFTIMAFMLEDEEFFDISYSVLKKYRKSRVITDIMKYKMHHGSNFVPLPKSADVPANKMTINEYNCLVVVKAISDGISSLLKM